MTLRIPHTSVSPPSKATCQRETYYGCPESSPDTVPGPDALRGTTRTTDVCLAIYTTRTPLTSSFTLSFVESEKAFLAFPPSLPFRWVCHSPLGHSAVFPLRREKEKVPLSPPPRGFSLSGWCTIGRESGKSAFRCISRTRRRSRRSWSI